MQVILYSPDIPQNVGNIARTCAATETSLTLVRPLRFNLSAKEVKRAGMDYLEMAQIKMAECLEDVLVPPFYFFSTKGKKPYTEIDFAEETSLVFGSETAGLPQWIHEKWPTHFYTIPMCPAARSLNLSNAVAIVLYEALRQQKFRGLLRPSSVGHRDL
jgi:tRNA (cytidine/uridine-2'-O-)-methyltransferase